MIHECEHTHHLNWGPGTYLEISNFCYVFLFTSMQGSKIKFA